MKGDHEPVLPELFQKTAASVGLPLNTSPWQAPIPPLILASARRLLGGATLHLDLPGFYATGLLNGRLSVGNTTTQLSLSLSPVGLISSCGACETREAPLCSHAAAALLTLREHQAQGAAAPQKAAPPQPFPNDPPPLRNEKPVAPPLREAFRCTTLLLSGSRKSPYFLALGPGNRPLTHEEFQALECEALARPERLTPTAALFARSFEPWHPAEKDRKSVLAFRPRSGTPSIFSYFAEPGISILSPRTLAPYRLSRLSTPPFPEFSARWSAEAGGELLITGQIPLPDGPPPLKNVFWMVFDSCSMLCGNGALFLFPSDPPVPPPVFRLMDRLSEKASFSPAEWGPLLDPEGGGAIPSLSFPTGSPPLVFGSRRHWTPCIGIRGRHDGGLDLSPSLVFDGRIAVPLFGPERHRLPTYLSGFHPPKSDGDSGPDTLFVVGRDREKELYFRNIFEKIARMSGLDATILVERNQSARLLGSILPDLEKAGFAVDRSMLYDGSILPGPYRIALSVSGLSRERVRVAATLQTGRGSVPFPPPEARGGQGFPDEEHVVVAVRNGGTIYLEGTAREHYRDIRRFFTLDDEGTAAVSRYYLSMLWSLRPDLPIYPDDGLAGQLEPFSPSPLPPPVFDRLAETFTATLRPYQKEAISFLVSLWDEGLSGILADEMGLGKTISVLGFLRTVARERGWPQGSRPPLIALPASLLYNWTHEAERFSPGIRLHVHAGTGRRDRQASFADADLILTTYGTIRNDLHLASGPPFSCLVMDEAHLVKNPDSRIHKALHALPALNRIAVTGTPVENRLLDLWGIFNNLMPGFLGSRTLFEHRFFHESRQNTSPDGDRIDLLRKLVSPLILRRTKEKVLAELPPKVEMDVWIDPSPEERATYARLKRKGTMELGPPERSGASSRMAYLTLLLRLRQLACHPQLLPPDMRGGLTTSSKFETVLDKICEGVEEGHKILLFSQFTSVLDLFEERLPEKEIRFIRLDGSTPITDRKARVDAFQSDDPASPAVFLASLKAGGVGLTLTRADYVFHYDPWWNPQVEAQASDRSHRIGQKKKVFITRFLTRGTVEERVRILKESKKDIFDRLVGDPRSGDPMDEHDSAALSIADMQLLLDIDPFSRKEGL